VAIPPEPEPEEPEAEPEPDPDEEARIQREEEEQQKVQVYKSNLEMAKDMAKNDPRIVANVIKEWLGTE
jgi:flagellar M-ring protein FliF